MTTIKVSMIDWLRNDYNSEITVAGISYPSVEHAYQASKFQSNDTKRLIARSDVNSARKIGRENKADVPGWDGNKIEIMELLIRQKFTNNTVLRDRLIKTNDDEFIIDNLGDYWGNILTKIFTKVRLELQLLSGWKPQKPVQKPPSLKEALTVNPDAALVNACSEMYDGVKVLMTLADVNDFNKHFISSRTGLPIATVEDAMVKLQQMMSGITKIEDLLNTKVPD